MVVCRTMAVLFCQRFIKARDWLGETPIAKARIANLGNSQIDKATQRQQLDLVQALNQEHLNAAERDQGIEGLIANYELAFRMQTTIPQLMDLDTESAETHDLYGIGKEPTDNFGRQCLLARKFAEAGVRYIQVSTDYTWDHHQKNNEGLIKETARVDRPIHGLLTDLARRGLLDDTLFVWAPSSDVRPLRRTPMVAAIIHKPLPCGWQAPESKVALRMEQPTTSATHPFTIQSTCTTCMRLCYTPWGSITSD